MQTNKKFILGGGISGKVLQFYNPEFTIITPDQGMFANSYLVLIHDTSETRKLLTELGYQNVDKLHRKSYMGYYHDGWISEELSPAVSLILIQKKMTNWNEPLDTSFVPKSYEMSTRQSKTVNYMNVLDVNPSEIIQKLDERKGEIINGFVEKIYKKEIAYRVGDYQHTAKYDEIISTIPAPFFWKAYGEERNYKSMPITNVMTKVKPEMFNDKFTTTYYTDEFPFTRIAHMGDTYAFEFTGIITKEEFEKLYPEYPVENIFVVKQGRIFQEDNKPPQENITFSGRFGCWDFRITSEHVIHQAINYKNSKIIK